LPLFKVITVIGVILLKPGFGLKSNAYKETAGRKDRSCKKGVGVPLLIKIKGDHRQDRRQYLK
jgi:hypothetical protein